ncbi:hypothetical protein HK101_006312 [Irineochytrium annulatum]|nr:hypothetical protein HK101_006312 [Irineochytrium annulatum]
MLGRRVRITSSRPTDATRTHDFRAPGVLGGAQGIAVIECTAVLSVVRVIVPRGTCVRLSGERFLDGLLGDEEATERDELVLARVVAMRDNGVGDEEVLAEVGRLVGGKGAARVDEVRCVGMDGVTTVVKGKAPTLLVEFTACMGVVEIACEL